MPSRTVLHVDLDAFFVAVERVCDPQLRGRPVVVGGPPERRGVVAAASYEARAFGIRSAMSMAEALRRCPDLVRVDGRGDLYRRASRAVFALFAEVAPVVEPVSVDEAYLDLTGTGLLFPRAVDAADRLRREVRERLRLDVSVGVAHNRLVGKVASALAKPRGLLEVPPPRAARFFAPLPVGRLPGVGPVTERRLRDLRIARLGELAATETWFLERVFGRWGPGLQRRARAEDDTPVRPPWERPEAVSVGHERTFAHDVGDLRELRARLQALLEDSCARLRRKGLAARTLTLKLRWADFTTVTRDVSLPEPTDHDLEWWPHARALLDRLLGARRTLVRLLGVRLSGLVRGFTQPDLFAAEAAAAARRRQAVLDRLRARYGADHLRHGDRLWTAGTARPRPTPSRRPARSRPWSPTSA